MMSEEELLEEGNSQESILIFSRKSTQVILTVGATIFLLLCGQSFLVTVFNLKNWWEIVVLVLWLLLIVGCALLVFLFLRYRVKPILIINREGIEDHSHLGISFGTVRVKWEEVAIISPTNDRRAPGFQVALTAKDQQTFLARQSRWSRFLLHTPMTKLGDFSQCILLPRVLLPMTASSLIAQIKEHFLPHEIILQDDEL